MIADRFQDLVGRLTDDVTALVRSEIGLAKAELRASAMLLARAAAFALVAAVLIVLALFALVQAAIYGLGETLPLWASGLIVGAVLIGIAAILALLASKAAKRAKPVPELAVAEAQATVDELKEVRL